MCSPSRGARASCHQPAVSRNGAPGTALEPPAGNSTDDQKPTASRWGSVRRLSTVLTGVMVPPGHDADALRKVILDRFDMSLGTGLGKGKGKVCRIGDLGDLNNLTLVGTLAGAVMIAYLRNRCAVLGWPNHVQEMIVGHIVILAVAVDLWRRRRHA